MRISNLMLVVSGVAFAGVGIFAAIMLTMSAVAASGAGAPERAVSAAPARTLQSDAQVSWDLVDFELKNGASVVGAITPSAVSTDETAFVSWSSCVTQLYNKDTPWWARPGRNVMISIQCTFFD